MVTTPLCDALGIEVPIWNAGMGGGLAGPELAASVCNAGGLGVLGMGGLPTPAIRESIRRVRELTDRPFGVNLIMPLMDEGAVACCLEERVPVLVLFWGDPSPYVDAAHRVGTNLLVQCGSVEEARQTASAGVDAVMVQGVEAGGHVRGTTALSILLPATVEAVAPLPVIAAGGIATGRGVAAALTLGAQAVSLGTRFLCSDESRAAPEYKHLIVAAAAEDTVYTKMFDVGWPDAAHRVLRTAAVREWEAAGSPPLGERGGEGDIIGKMPVAGQIVDLPRYGVFMPLEGFEGDLEQAVLYSGQSCALVNDVLPAAQIVHDLVQAADALIAAATA
jgi:NAD(P)H-dependent flavin oxidoreductase YrpB (nitropropane dioxygenase family)